MVAVEEGLLNKVAARLSQAPSYASDEEAGSVLLVAAAAYSSGLKAIGQEEVTQPTGFDPHAAALFEAAIESAFLVANADGIFDDAEQAAFEQVIITACQGNVSQAQVNALLADLTELLIDDGMDKRVSMVARTIKRADHAQEVLRIAGLLAHASAGVSIQERGVLQQLATAFGLDPAALEQALVEVQAALAD